MPDIVLDIAMKMKKQQNADLKQFYRVRDALPKCWRLVNGKLVQDYLVVPGDILYQFHPMDTNQYWKIVVETIFKDGSVECRQLPINYASDRIDGIMLANSPKAAELAAEMIYRKEWNCQ